MSKASDIRDTLADYLGTQFPDNPVDRAILPRYKREAVGDAARIAVRVGGREVTIGQGPNPTDVRIDIGVIGITPIHDGEHATFDEATLAKCDEYDALMESIIGLWANGGALAYMGVADHSFQGLETIQQVDFEQLHSGGVYLSVIQLTFRDCEE